MKKFLMPVAVVLLLCGQKASAQYGFSSMYFSRWDPGQKYKEAKAAGANLRNWWASEQSVGLAFAAPMPYVMRHFYYTNGFVSDQNLRDTAIRGSSGPAIGFSANTNSNHLLLSLGTTSMLSFSSGLQLDYLRWKAAVYTDYADEWTIRIIRAGLPLTLEYKFGCDVNYKIDVPVCFALGGGAYPWAGAVFGGDLPGKVIGGISPYLYASVGFYAGVCFKVRTAYIPGTRDFKRTGYENPYPDSFSGRMPGSFQVSLAVMANSRDWRGYKAWREPLFGKSHRDLERRRRGKEAEE